MLGDVVNGFVERKADGSFAGKITIDGVLLPSITASYFEKDGQTYVWLRRTDVMDYDFDTGKYVRRKAEPQWESYLKKQNEGQTVAFTGEFVFMKFVYSICGIWDRILGTDKNRLNLFVERKPMSEQRILLGINKKRKENNGT